MLTAVTQVDGNGRQVRTFRQSSYYRSISTGSTYKDNIGLLQTTAASPISATTTNVPPVTTPALTRKSSSVKSPHPNQRALVTICPSNGDPRRSSSLPKHNYNHRMAAAAASSTTAAQSYHNHLTEIIQNDNSVSSCSDDSSERACLSSGGIEGSTGGEVSIVLSYNNQHSGVASMKNYTSSPLGDGETRNCLLTPTSGSSMGLQPLLSGMVSDNVSSV